MRLISVFVLCCITSVSVMGQSTLTISGKIVDKDTNEPLAYASIGVKNQPIGTVSNSVGEFDFHIPTTFKNEILVISMLGYENFRTPISNILISDTLVFRLNKTVQVLEEVVIADSLTGGEIVQIALTKIEDNYSMHPFMLEGFYRDVKKLGGTYFSLLEAAVTIYDEDYTAPLNKYRLRENVGLIEVRKSLGYNNKFTSYFDQGNLLEDLLLHNNIRYRQFAVTSAFFKGIERLKSTYYNGHKVFVVRQTNDYYLKMFIDAETYAILRMEYEIHYKDVVLKKKRNLVSKYISDKKIIDFKSYNNTLYLNYMSLDSKINWYDSKTGVLKFETMLHQELLINKIYPNGDRTTEGTEKMKRYGLQYQDQPYNEAFWNKYNVIKETPLDRKIIRDLEKSGSLEEQFKN